MNKPLKYQGYTIAFQEIPNETSLIFNISGCPHRCEGCHSQYLWSYDGHYLSEDYEDIIRQYKDYITCVCFMGGDQNSNELISFIMIANHKYNLKTALYSGYEEDDNNHFLPYWTQLDYLKIGSYKKEYGGLDKITTNQKMYKYNPSTDKWEDITYVFQRKEKLI